MRRRTILAFLVVLAVSGCGLFQVGDDLDRAMDVTSEYIRLVAAGKTRKAYGLTSSAWQASVPYEKFAGWAASHRSQYQELADEPDLGVRGATREDSAYYVTVMLDGMSQTWRVVPEDGKWVLDVPKPE